MPDNYCYYCHRYLVNKQCPVCGRQYRDEPKKSTSTYGSSNTSNNHSGGIGCSFDWILDSIIVGILSGVYAHFLLLPFIFLKTFDGSRFKLGYFIGFFGLIGAGIIFSIISLIMMATGNPIFK